MNERIQDKIDELRGYLEEVYEIVPDSLEEYKDDFKAKAACERYAERIIEAVTDLAFLVVKEKRFASPESDLQAFEILSENKVISFELSKKLQDAKSMRNILAHEYGKVDDEIVFNSLKEELRGDVTEFIEIIKEFLKNH